MGGITLGLFKFRRLRSRANESGYARPTDHAISAFFDNNSSKAPPRSRHCMPPSVSDRVLYTMPTKVGEVRPLIAAAVVIVCGPSGCAAFVVRQRRRRERVRNDGVRCVPDIIRIRHYGVS
jgi:nitrogenase molybdenum-iron protein alpha/beta subunit